MSYHVKDIFLTLQGEGAFSGQVAVFCRFIGCNLWTGYEKDRHKAQCSFCDTDFVKPACKNGGFFKDASQLAQHIASFWPPQSSKEPHTVSPFVVFTGGEPLLQLDADLITHMHKRGFFISVESNGTVKAPPGIDWLCVSPKENVALQQRCGDELKLVFPQSHNHPMDFEHLNFKRFSLQPLDTERGTRANIDKSVAYCLKHPQWSLSLQTHKFIGID